MIKYFCDRCGVEMTKEKRHGFVSVNTRDKAEGDLLEENEFESWLFCKKCTEDIRRYVRTLPLKPSQNDENRLKTMKSVIKIRKNVIKTRESVANLLKVRQNRRKPYLRRWKMKARPERKSMM